MSAVAVAVEGTAKPFLRWAGGKAKLVPELIKLAPKSWLTYREPFLGGGALFFALQPKHVVLSDANDELIHAYTIVRDRPAELIDRLVKAAQSHSKEHYYFVRTLDPRTLDPVTRAARFIYLNSTCFNGLYRVNSKGRFNVPWDPGRSGSVNEHVITAASVALRGQDLYSDDFRKVEHAAIAGDFVYFDCPYVPLTATSNFTGYTTGGFTHKDQIDLRDMALRLKRNGVHVLLSNSGTPVVEQLYSKDFELHPVAARRNINSKSTGRDAVKEYIIR